MPARPLHGRCILVAEDEYLLADAMDRALRRVGARILGPVASVESGLRILATGTPDAASLDLDLGGERVYPLADALIGRGVPFLFTTGYDRAVIPEAYARIRCLRKPLEPRAVVTELVMLLKVSLRVPPACAAISSEWVAGRTVEN